jgi:hypothetical protein
MRLDIELGQDPEKGRVCGNASAQVGLNDGQTDDNDSLNLEACLHLRPEGRGACHH